MTDLNKFAKRERQRRSFSTKKLLLARLKRYLTSRSSKKGQARIEIPAAQAHTTLMKRRAFSPQRKLTFQATFVAFVMFVLSGFSNVSGFTAGAVDYTEQYLDSYFLPGEVLIADDEGFLVKINPQTETSTRQKLRDFAVHTVASSETLSEIAEQYGVRTNTIMWANGISNANRLRAGQQLSVPPIDGISYKVSSGDTIDKIAKKYDIVSDIIIAHNELEDASLQRGQRIFLPGAEPVYEAAPQAVYTAGNYVQADLTPNNSAPAAGQIFIFPTTGRITQGYRPGHYAFDIANRASPTIWAAGAGTVEKVKYSNVGYGNHLVINHGGGLKTLYAHFASISVSVGDQVDQGTPLGVMGTTGRSTGIHLHWEVISGGIKQNPANYY
jgi:murein DD-endopeptidase MepM/ murein hydrolase activator NlpD